MVQTTVGVTSFRNNIKVYFEQAELTPLAINRNTQMYVLMTKEHYIDLINKTRFPQLTQMPQGVQTIVHFTPQNKIS